MAKSKSVIIIIIIAIILVAGAYILGRSTARTEPSREIESLRNTIDEYKQLYNFTRTELAKIGEENRQLEEQLRIAENTAGILEARIGEFERRFAELQKRYNEIKKLAEEGAGNIDELDSQNRAAIEYVRKIRKEYYEAAEIIDKLREKN